MLKKMSIRKIMVASLTLFILMILYLLPDNTYDNEINLKNSDIEYIYNNTKDTIYLLDSNDYVARTSINSCDCSLIDKSKDLVEGLIIGGKKSNIIPNGFRSIIPSGTVIKDIRLEDKILTIDFSRELMDINANYEEKMIEAIVYTLTSIDGIDKVVITVEGEKLDKLPRSGKKIPDAIDKSYGVNKVYDLNTIRDIDYYTVYYVTNFNDNSYYVPVTKYINNDNQDKIKVIIKELASAPIYESNLMSFLNVGSELIDYSIEDNKLVLNFNNDILSDVVSNNILEEVIYTVSLSMGDNLNVDEVVFCVDNEEIFKSLVKELE